LQRKLGMSNLKEEGQDDGFNYQGWFL
jgi:hypothetical protein